MGFFEDRIVIVLIMNRNSATNHKSFALKGNFERRDN